MSCPGHLPLVKEAQCPCNRRLAGPQSQCGYFGEEKRNLFSPPGFDT